MTERPILFSAPMVRAIMSGSKSQTRRIIKLPHNNPLGVWEATTVGGPGTYTKNGDPYPERAAIWHTRTGTTIVPPYAEGGRLWVREAWQYAPQQHCHCPQGAEPAPCDDWSNGTGCRSNRTGVIYRADGGSSSLWRPSIHMPCWASRITLEITDVRAQRLQDISEDDAQAEGCIHHHDPAGDGQNVIEQFSYLWTSIHGPGSWQANPWVAAITFERLK